MRDPHGPSLPVAKQTIRLRGTCQEVSKACIGWHDHVGCYAKKNNNEKLKLYESVEMYESLEIRESLEIYESFETHAFLQPIFRFVESFQAFIQVHEYESNLINNSFEAICFDILLKVKGIFKIYLRHPVTWPN